MGIILTLLSFEQVILPNGIELIPAKVKNVNLLIEFPENCMFKGRAYDTGILIKRFKDIAGLYNFLMDSLSSYPAHHRKIRYKTPLLNLIFGIYSSTKGYSAIKVILPESLLDSASGMLDPLPDTLVVNTYRIDDLLPIQGFFLIPSKVCGYYNLPPDMRETGIIEFSLLMEIFKMRGLNVVYSKTGRKMPFFIKGRPEEIFPVLDKGIGIDEMKKAKDCLLARYKSIKNSPLNRAIFLSVSGVNPEDFDLRWRDWIKITERDRVERLRIIYTNGGIISINPEKIPSLLFLLPGAFIDG